MITDANAALAAYKNNELDMSGVRRVREDHHGRRRSEHGDLRYSELTTFAFQFNVTKAPFDNVNGPPGISPPSTAPPLSTMSASGVGKAALSGSRPECLVTTPTWAPNMHSMPPRPSTSG